MEQKNTLINKPPFAFTVQLFIFMLIVVWKFIGLIYNLDGFWWDCIGAMPLEHFIISWLTDFFAFGYCLSSIYKALQAKPYSISMLKIGTIYIGIQLVLTSFNYIGAVMPIMPIAFLPMMIACLIFVVYLYRSKRLKEFIPVNSRIFGIYGYWGISIYVFFLCPYIYCGVKSYFEWHRSLPIDKNEITLKKGEMTDGFIVFRPLSNWNRETIAGSPKEGYTFLFNDESDNKIMIRSFLHESCNNRVDYNVLVAGLYKVIKNEFTLRREIAYTDSMINDAKFYSNTYEILDKKGELKYWTISALVPKNLQKLTLVSYLEKNGYSRSLVDTKIFMEGISFNLEK